jgi:Protein of unknown function (DUF5132)
MKLGDVRISSGVLIGAGVVLLAPVVIPVIAGLLRPVLKAGIKTGLITYHKVKEVTAEAVESVEDLAAEAKAEMAASEEEKGDKPKKSAAKAKA